MADTTGGTANPGGNLPRPTPEQIFRTILGCTTLSEEFIDQVLIASRFRNIRVATNLSQDQLDALEVKAQALGDDFSFEFLEFAKIVNVFRYHKFELRNEIQYADLTEDAIFTMIEAYTSHIHVASVQRAEQAVQTSFRQEETPSEPDSESFVKNHVAKKSLNNVDTTMPPKPISYKQMKTFKLDLKNELRSMGLEYVLEESYKVPEESDPEFTKYIYDNKFVYSVLMKVTKGHEAREWLLAAEVENEGREGWFRILKHYDVKDLEGSNLSTAMNRLVGFRLNKNHIGAASSYVTNFASTLSELTIEGTPLDTTLSKEMFLNGITHPDYFEVKTNLKLNGLDLNTCMQKITLIAGSIEREAEKSSRRIAQLNQQQSHQNGQSLKYMGQDLDEYGFFKNVAYFNNLSQTDKRTYFNERKEWLKEGKCKNKARNRRGANPGRGNGGRGSNNKEAKFIRNLCTALNVDEDGNIQQNASTNSDSPPSTNLTPGSDTTARIAALIKSKCQLTHTTPTFNGDLKRINQVLQSSTTNCVADSGADTCLLGSAFTMISLTDRKALVGGFDDTLTIGEKNIGSGVAAYDKSDGSTILLLVNEAIDHCSQPNTMLSLNQMRHYGVDVCDVHPHFTNGGRQGLFRIKVGDHELPFRMENGLAALKVRRPTDSELVDCEVVRLTADSHWDPSYLQGNNFIPGSDKHTYLRSGGAVYNLSTSPDPPSSEPYSNHPGQPISSFLQQCKTTTAPKGSNFSGFESDSAFSKTIYDNMAQYAWHELDSSEVEGPSLTDNDIFGVQEYVTRVANLNVVKRKDKPPDLTKAQRTMGWAPLETIRRTFEATTQYAKAIIATGAHREHYKSRNPGLNQPRNHETFATDTLFASEKDISGATCAQIFVGTTSLLTYVYGMKTESEGASKLKKFIKEVGAPHALKSDNAKMQTGTAFGDICNYYNIGQCTTEPYHPHQNQAENRIGTIKQMSNRIMDRTGAPNFLWLRAITFTCMLLNVLASKTLDWRTPSEKGLGVTPDTSQFLQFTFYEPVFYRDPVPNGYPQSIEKLGHWVGPAEHVGDIMFSWILTDKKT